MGMVKSKKLNGLFARTISHLVARGKMQTTPETPAASSFGGIYRGILENNLS